MERTLPGSARSLVVSVCALALVAGLVGCRTAPMIQPDVLSYRGTASGSPAQVHAAIVRGARRAGWSTETSDPDSQTIDARFMVRPQVFVIVRIDYGGGQISFRYVDSSRFNCEPIQDGCTTIHKSYNTRLLRLRTRIGQALSETATRPIEVSQAVSIVRQLVEEQPRRKAYTTVDVTEERVSAIREVVKPVYHTTYGHGWGHGWGFYPHDFFHRRHGFHFGSHFGPGFGRTEYVSTSQADVVYFNNIGRIELRPGGRWQVIQIWDRHGQSRIRLYSLDEELATRFVDAIGVLVQARLDVEDDAQTPVESPAD